MPTPEEMKNSGVELLDHIHAYIDTLEAGNKKAELNEKANLFHAAGRKLWAKAALLGELSAGPIGKE